MTVHETDVCIIGGGITSAMLAERLADLRPGTTHHHRRGRPLDLRRRESRAVPRSRVDYGEHPWHDDYIEDQKAEGIISMTMAVGGLALHWGGACNRFSEEDLRLKSMYGLADRLADRLGRARALLRGSGAGAERRRRAEPLSGGSAHAPYPQPAVPLSYNLQVLKAWAEQSGVKF